MVFSLLRSYLLFLHFSRPRNCRFEFYHFPVRIPLWTFKRPRELMEDSLSLLCVWSSLNRWISVTHQQHFSCIREHSLNEVVLKEICFRSAGIESDSVLYFLRHTCSWNQANKKMRCITIIQLRHKKRDLGPSSYDDHWLLIVEFPASLLAIWWIIWTLEVQGNDLCCG